MGKFDFSKSTIKSDEELSAKMEDGFKERPYLDPGTYEVVIKEVKAAGTDRYDSSWEQYEITFEDAGKKTIKTFLKVPTSEFEYVGTKTGKPSMAPFRKVNQFVTALTGTGLTKRNAADQLTSLFGKPEKSLPGKAAKIVVGYDRMHVAYKGKDEAGIKKYVIQDGKTGSVLADASGKTLTFPEFEAAKEYAEQNNVNLQRFADVLQVSASAAATMSKPANW